MLSAALTRTEGGALGSTMIFIRVAAAALVACCNRAIDWANACRRDSRYTAANSGILSQRRSVLIQIPAVPHASGLKLLSRQQAGSSKSHRSCRTEPLASKANRQAFGCNVRLIPITNSQRQSKASAQEGSFHASTSKIRSQSPHERRRPRWSVAV